MMKKIYSLGITLLLLLSGVSYVIGQTNNSGNSRKDGAPGSSNYKSNKVTDRKGDKVERKQPKKAEEKKEKENTSK